MSRSNPQSGSPNPCTRWFEWAGGDNGGYVKYYDRDAKENVVVPLPFIFLVLDELSTVKGWHDPSDSAIYSNEVRDTRKDPLVVKAFKGGELATGIYTQIRDRVKAQGAHYVASLYCAFREGENLHLGNLQLKGAALNAWVEFRKKHRNRIYQDAMVITGFEDGKKGATKFRIPTFGLKKISQETDKAALLLDEQLQAFLSAYLARMTDEQAETMADATASLYTSEAAVDDSIADQMAARDDFNDDIPF